MNPFTNAASQPPVTRRTDHVDRLHEVDVPDPYRWLEDVDSPDIKTWIQAQNEHTQSVLSHVPLREEGARTGGSAFILRSRGDAEACRQSALLHTANA